MQLSPRDQALLQLLDRTPATAPQIRKASVTFSDDPFSNDRRVRERMQALIRTQLVRSFSLAVTGGGLANYYKLTPEGFRLLRGPDAALPHRSHFAALSPSQLLHTLELADVIIHTLVATHTRRIKLTGFHRENELKLEVGQHRTSPDCHVQFASGARTFNVLFELDRSTESLDSIAANSVRRKLLAYEAYQDYAWSLWKQDGEQGPRPYFRVAFLTVSIERAHHILALARNCARNADRHLCCATTVDAYISEPDAAREPIFLDHHGHWQALVNIFPSSAFAREPVRIAPLSQRFLPL